MSTNLWPFRKKVFSKRMHIDDDLFTQELGKSLLLFCRQHSAKELVVACIGTDRSTGDALGPLLGTMLQKRHLTQFTVYGTLEAPLHAVNLENRLKDIHELHPHAFLIAVDACLGRQGHVGSITLSNQSLKPGAAMGKSLPEVGDCSLTGVVNAAGLMDFHILQSTRLHEVMTMAEKLQTLFTYVDAQLKQSTQKKHPSLFQKKGIFTEL
ncbi:MULTISPECIES: spore protease YyaC [Shouchella]|uniref:Spore protease YyaC n=2 Tax=Shouchella TaxID=2893057 RepID=A0ABY7WCE8_9BACI|nr:MULTISPECIES: spore protease YyaC [Shouchella]MED4129856.1 spore protease YyaC [Shouchella miscanthi]WDF05308.1 spore protease YyaC [Shouchella hunanensis]